MMRHRQEFESRHAYQCPLAGCGKRYTMASNLRRHVRVVHEAAEAAEGGSTRAGAQYGRTG